MTDLTESNEKFRNDVLSWLEKNHPAIFEKFKDNLDFNDGTLKINNNNGLDYLEQEILIRIIDERSWVPTD